MATRTSKFQVGLFLIAGFLLLNGALIWIGASRVLEPRIVYTTYFKESVQGLDVGSPVKYRGVPLGRVSSIRVAPDGRLVEVQMELDPSFRVLKGMYTRMASAGITGAAFVDLGFPPEGAPKALPPKLSFPPPPNYIPSQPSFLTNLMAGLADLFSNLHEMDLPALAREYKALAVDVRSVLGGAGTGRTLDRIAAAATRVEELAQRMEQLLGDPRVGEALDRISSAARSLDEAAGGVQALVTSPRLGAAIADAREAARNLRGASARLLEQTGELRAGERLDKVQEKLGTAADRATAFFEHTGQGADAALSGATDVVDRADRLLGDVDRSLQDALERLTRASARIEELAGTLEADPSRILLAKPPPKDFR